MLDTPEILQTTAQHAAIIPLTVSRDEIQFVMGPALQEIYATLGAQNLAPTGPWYTHHLKMDPEVFEFEVSVPVATPIAPMGRVQPGILPAATVARTTYHGPYEALGDAWGEFMDWIIGEGHRPAADLWEVYLTTHHETIDPSEFRTQLNRPVLLAQVSA